MVGWSNGCWVKGRNTTKTKQKVLAVKAAGDGGKHDCCRSGDEQTG